MSHLCLALKLLRLFGWSFLIVIFASPNRISLVLLPSFARTANFFPPLRDRLGLLYPENFSPARSTVITAPLHTVSRKVFLAT